MWLYTALGFFDFCSKLAPGHLVMDRNHRNGIQIKLWDQLGGVKAIGILAERAECLLLVFHPCYPFQHIPENEIVEWKHCIPVITT